MIRAASRLSDHIIREIEASQPGRPLGEGQSVPGCTCHCCVLQTLGLTDDARIAAEDLVCDLARFDPAIRLDVASEIVESWLTQGLRLPSAGILADLASRVDGARRSSSTLSSDELPVKAARAVPILQVAHEVLGLDLRRRGNSWRGPCPIHDGEGPNFSVDPARGTFRCFVCDAGGDAIELVQQVSSVGFADAVRLVVK